MSVKKFKFISPGIFLSEVDNSQLPAPVEPMGPIIIGRARLGPAMRPVKVNSFSEFVQTFGNPIPGKAGGDIWRAGNLGGPTYGIYAAQAYYEPQVGPVTYMRLLGAQAPAASLAGRAGWSNDNALTGRAGPTTDVTTNAGAYGLFLCQSSSAGGGNPQKGYLGAIFYMEQGAVVLTGSLASELATAPVSGGTCGLFEPIGDFEYKAQILPAAVPVDTNFPATVTSTVAGPHALVALDDFDLTIDAGALVTPVITVGATPNTIQVSDVEATWTVALANGDDLIININGTGNQTATLGGLTPGAATAVQVAASLNPQLTGVSVSALGGIVTITNDIVGTDGTLVIDPASTCLVLASGAGYMTITLTSSTANVGNIAAVTDTELAALIQALITPVTPGSTAVAAVGGGITITGVTLGPTGQIIIGAGTGLAAKLGFTPATVIGTSVAGQSALYTSAFNFNESSAKYIRNVFNTNPQLTNGAVIDDSGFAQGQQNYWLGESYASWINLKSSTKTPLADRLVADEAYAVILPLQTHDGVGKDEYRMPFAYAKTGWFFSQDLSTATGSYRAVDMQKLFRFEAQDGGRWVQDNLKISIQDIKYSRDTSGRNPYGSFTVLIRRATDNDNVGPNNPVERFSNVNLNPSSENYIARKIGTKYLLWDDTELRMRQYGEYNNQSRFVRVVMDENVDNGVTDPKYLPFGVYGPTRYKECLITGEGPTGTTGQSCDDSIIDGGDTSVNAIVGSSAGSGFSTGSAGGGYTGIPDYTASLVFPDVAVRHTASAGGLANPTDAYFGLQTSLELEQFGSLLYNNGYVDYLWPAAHGTTSETEPQWVFSLDDVSAVTASVGVTTPIVDAQWASGSRANGVSLTCGTDINGVALTGLTISYKEVLDASYNRFTSPLYGGFDGLNITELEPFRNSLLLDANPLDSYAYYSVKRAIDTVADPEFVECNLLSMPGLTNATLTTRLIDVCEDRGDALAVVDIPFVYEPFTETTESFAERIGTVAESVSELEQRQLNSSYGCTYYPWVQIRDTIAGNLLWVPPSVTALGTFASSQKKSELWFAPAGFNRGGLTGGSAGLPVLGVTQRLTSKDRDDLYEANINPIASFPSEGIVVFGQKTLQTTRSALDRINVRRLMIYIKKEISRIAATILFDQNVKVTWERFLGQANPFLSSVQSRLGLTEFRVILDDTTTTPDLIDRNILYAKIFLKPARAIEFIAIDFVITRTGASFED